MDTGVKEANVSRETRRGNGPGALRRFHLVCRGPDGFSQARQDAQATHKAPQLPGMGSALPSPPSPIEQPVGSTLGVDGALPVPPDPQQTYATPDGASVLGGAIAGDPSPWHGWLSTAIRAQRGGYIS